MAVKTFKTADTRYTGYQKMTASRKWTVPHDKIKRANTSNTLLKGNSRRFLAKWRSTNGMVK